MPKNYVVSNATIAVIANGFSLANHFKHELIPAPNLEKAIRQNPYHHTDKRVSIDSTIIIDLRSRLETLLKNGHATTR